MLQQNTSQFEVSFWNTKIVWIFIFQNHGKVWSILLEHFIKHKPLYFWRVSFCMIIFWNNNNVLSIKKVIFSPSIQHYFFYCYTIFLQVLLFQQKIKSKSDFTCELFMRFIIKDEKMLNMHKMLFIAWWNFWQKRS